MQWFELSNRSKMKIITKCLQTSLLRVKMMIARDKQADNLPSHLVTVERDSNAIITNQHTCTSLIAPLFLRSIFSLVNVEKASLMRRTLIFIQGLNKIAKSHSAAIFATNSLAQGETCLITDVGMIMISKLARTNSTFHQPYVFSLLLKSNKFLSVVLDSKLT